MKKLLILAAAFCGLILLPGTQSCQSSKNSTATKLLKFNLEKGKGYDYEMTMNMDQEIMGQKIQMDMSTYYSMDVEAEDNDTKTITTSIDRFKIKTGAAGFNIEVDTDKPVPAGDDSDISGEPTRMMSKIFGAIKGRKFSMKVNAEGKVVSVSGFEHMAESLADSLEIDSTERAQMISQFNTQFNGEKIGSQLERFWYIFPNKEVKVGESWQKNSQLGGELPGNYSSIYKVTEIEGDMVTLEEKTKIESDQGKMKLKGNITGTIVVDSRSGLIVTADQDMKITAETEGKSFDIAGKSRIKGKAR